jgi:hypothetical protein
MSTLGEQIHSWNVAIRDVVFSQEKAGQSVYLDLDVEVFERILEHKSVVGKTKSDLFSDVRAILNLNAPGDLVLESLSIQSRSWVYKAIDSKDPDDVPPMLAFLAVTVAAAEEMGSGDADANAYYSHLCRLLSIEHPSTEANKLQSSYRALVEDLWSYLNRWLIDIGYRRGIPTAYAITQRFVGIPVSQALVRETDRNRLPAMFYFYGLSNDNPISIPEMEELVSLWILRDEFSVSAAVRRLWLDPQAREQICIAFCDELSKWDGQYAPQFQAGLGIQNRAIHNRKLLVGAWFANQLGTKSIQISILAPVSYAATESDLKLRHDSGSEIVFSRLNESYFEAQEFSDAAIQSVMNSILELQAGDAQSLRREPTSIVTLSFDEHLQGFIETKRLPAGQDALLLVKDFKNLLVETKAFLDRNARPGYEMLGPGTKGVPEGWWLFRNVQITEIDNQLVSSADKEKFAALIPTGLPQLVLSGGVKLPGFRSLNQWLMDAPPELRAISQTSPSIKVTIEASDLITENPGSILELNSETGMIFVNLKEVDLAPGNYLATVFEGPKPVLSRRFALVPGDEPDLLLKTSAELLARDFTSNGTNAIFSASVSKSLDGVVLGAKSTASAIVTWQDIDFSRTAEWQEDEDKSTSRIVQLELAQLDENSCFYRGDHRWVLPTFGPRDTVPDSVIVGCSQCKSFSIQNLSARRAERLKEAGRGYLAVRNLRSTALAASAAPVQEGELNFNWNLIRSILNFSVAGQFNKLIETVKQLGESKYSANEVVDFLDQLGYIEVKRDSQGRGDYWRLTPTQVVRNSSATGEFYFLGATPKSMIQQFLSNIKAAGSQPSLDRTGAVVRLTGITEEAIKAACEALSIYYFDSSDVSVLEALPAFSLYLKESAREVLPAAESIALFDLQSGAWQDAEAMKPGAIRLKTKLGFKYFFVPTFAELEQGMGISCSATVAKYMLASSEQTSFISYREQSASLYVPLGAKLPGLYARPALLCDPQIPKKATLSRKSDASKYYVYKYANVSQKIAQGLVNRLAS